MFKSVLSVCANHCKPSLLVRNYGKHNKKFLYKDGVKVNNIFYYPRENDAHSLPETGEPSKLFRVRRIKPVKGCPHWEKRILRDLGLYESNAVAVVKNIPENNARLWKVKHLIEVLPIRFPHGEPTEADVNYTFLKENGDCVVVKDITSRAVRDDRLESAVQFTKTEERMDGETLRKDSRLKWLNPW
ncbi:large ribosomal subunit protein uL30m [Aedes albopictus]|uniref:Large ribosomal subunit protein uL30m n=1 Tax=Aedes albopictus TaxID=7160 RepID=A0ABM1YHF3_AEDAL